MKRVQFAFATAVFATAVAAGCSRSSNAPPVQTTQPTATSEAGAPAGDLFARLKDMRAGDDAKLTKDTEMLAQSLLDVDPDWHAPKANDQADRAPGPGAKIYRDVSESIVVVKTKTGHGTGSIIDERGWVITNHHVIARAAQDSTGARVATIYLGKLNSDGVMELDEYGLPAVVHCSDKDKDLAVLHIKNAKQKFKPIRFADKVPPAQHDCYAIGHPKSGLLWTVRKGEIAQIGFWPRDGVSMLSKRVSANPQDVEEMKTTMSRNAQMKIVLSNVGINSGDSGGPLVNEDGELISVTFAMPSDSGTASLAYHIHLEEVKNFLKSNDVVATRPAEAAASSEIDPWPVGAYLDLMDLDGDGRPDALGIAKTKGGALSGLMLDLRNENKIKSLADLGDQPKKWRFNLAIHFRPQACAYYDTQMNGTIDLVMTEKEPGGSIVIKRLEKGQWSSEDGGRRPLFDPILFSDRGVRERMTVFTKKLQEK